MRIFLTGATGFIGTHLVPELIGAGHHVVGLSRSDHGAETLRRAGAEVVRGDVNDGDLLRRAADAADGVVHAAFNHDFADLRRNSENDRAVVTTLGEALAGSDRPLVVSSGTGLVDRPASGAPVTETDPHATSAVFPRAATEEAADALVASGVRVMAVRLAQVHDTRHQGRIAVHVDLARRHGRVAYVGEGAGRLPAVHVSDAVRLYRLVLENGRSGGRYHAVAEQGVALRDVAAVIGARLGLPVESITAEAASEYFGAIADIAALDLSASGAATRRDMGWEPAGPDLLTDLHSLEA